MLDSTRIDLDETTTQRMLTRLREAALTGGNMVSFGRSLIVHQPDLHQWVISSTDFLDADRGFNERTYCLLNGLAEIQCCPLTGNPLKFANYFKGYKLSTVGARSDQNTASPITENEIEDLKRTFCIHEIPTFPKKYPDIYWKIMAATPSFGDASISERIFCLFNGVSQRPTKKFLSFNVGYAADFGKQEQRDELLEYAALVGSKDQTHGSKVKAFLKRNRERNIALYDLPDDEEGKSFVVCPVLGIRTLNIKRQYIEGVLLMSLEEFENAFPNASLNCSGLSGRIAKGLAVEIEPGITKYEASQKKAIATKSAIGEDGLTINDRKGLKTRETHMVRDADGLNGYQRIAQVARPKQHATMAAQGLRGPVENKSTWLAYRDFCNWLTVPHKKTILDGRQTGRMGTQDAWQVDHIYSQVKAFHEGISPFVVAHVLNLRALPWQENSTKSARCDFTKAELLAGVGWSDERSKAEFDIFIRAFSTLEEGRNSAANILLEMQRINDTEFPFKYPV